MNAMTIAMLPAKSIISVPILAASVLLACFWLATVVLAQSTTPPHSETSLEDFFRWAGWVVLIITLITIAAAAVYNVVRKAALNEYKELAEARKGKLVEAALEIANLKAEKKELEAENESLEKKNLRLQDENR